MKFSVQITYESKAETVEKGIAQVEGIIRVMGFTDFKVTHQPDQRTKKQNDSLHGWLAQVEEHCMERGLTAKVLFKDPGELPITRHMLKDRFRMFGNYMFHRKSTADLSKPEIDKVIKVCEQEYAEKLDCVIPFPSIDNPII